MIERTSDSECVGDTLQALRPDQRAARKQAARLRIAGVLILVFAIVVAGIWYWMETRSATPTLEELMPGSNAARARQVGILIGTFGVSLLQGWEYLQRPGTEAIILVAVAVLGALGCFRVAALLERYSDDPNRSRELPCPTTPAGLKSTHGHIHRPDRDRSDVT